MLRECSCGFCGAKNVRLYRPYPGFFREPDEDRCNACLNDEQRSYYIPLVLDENGLAWGYTSVPEHAFEQFLELPESSPSQPSWIPGTWWGKDI